jgi:hypothetical protein
MQGVLIMRTMTFWQVHCVVDEAGTAYVNFSGNDNLANGAMVGMT